MELTKEPSLTPAGDCIIGVECEKACADLDNRLKDSLRNEKGIIITLECNGIKDIVRAYGHPELTLTDPTSLVIRRSSFICPRTICVRADKAAADLDRNLIKELRKGGKLTVELSCP